MPDPSYTRFTIPMTALSDPAITAVVREALDIRGAVFRRIVSTPPLPDPYRGLNGIAIRLVSDCLCLVWEDEDCSGGGIDAIEALCQSRVPFIQVNDVGDDYGPSSTASDGQSREIIRLDHLSEAVVAVGMINGQAQADPTELKDYERYLRIVQAVLRVPVQRAA